MSQQNDTDNIADESAKEMPSLIWNNGRLLLKQNMMKLSNANGFRITGPVGGVIHRSPVDSPHKGPVTRAWMFSFMIVLTSG